MLGRLAEGNNTGAGTFLGVKGYGTQTNQYNGLSFALEHGFYGNTNSSINFFRGPTVNGGFLTFATNNNSEKMRIDANGNVGIGTTSPNQKLTVNGTIYGKEVKVDLNVPGPDYVFEKTYDLRSLEQVQSYIAENKHLPEIPSARELEANGVNVGEMNMLLLKKIEELTLYLLEAKSEINQLKQKVNTLEANRK